MDDRKSKNAIIIALCLTLVFMGVGFAFLSQELTINATGTISSSWDVHYASFVDNTAAGITATNTVNQGSDLTGSGYLDAENLNATVKFNLVKPGDAVQYKGVIQNYGTIKAGLASFTTALNDNEFIERTVTINGTEVTADASHNVLTPASLVLNQNDNAEVLVTYTFKDTDKVPEFNAKSDDSISDNDIYQVSDTISFGFVQK